MTTFTIAPLGPFSLRELALFGFGHQVDPRWDGTMRMAFCLDGYTEQVGVAVTADDAGVHVSYDGPADADAVRAQVARVLSLDHDGRVFSEIGRRDPVIGRLQQAAPGLRPPQFYSAYEGAAWSVLSARRPARQMAVVRRRLAESHGRVFEVAGERVAAHPTPEQLLGVSSFPGIPDDKLDRLHGVARAALDGALDTAAIAADDATAAMARLQKIKGIGPFYSALIVIRACGRADVLPDAEPKALALTGELYGFGRPVTASELKLLAENWQPLPTWTVVLIRAAGHRLATVA